LRSNVFSTKVQSLLPTINWPILYCHSCGAQSMPTKNFQCCFQYLLLRFAQCIIFYCLSTNWILVVFFTFVSSIKCHWGNAWIVQHLVRSKIWRHYVSKGDYERLGLISSSLLWLVLWLPFELHSSFKENKVREI
jgi:hypothetical protein